MPLPINKVKDTATEAQTFDQGDLNALIPFMQNQPLFILLEPMAGKKEKEAMKEMWLKSTDLGNERVSVADTMSQQNLSLLRSKGLIQGDGDVYEFTQSGKKVLKESILNEEESSFCKQASKQLVSKNSYDFGDEILVRVSHREKFGTRFISIPKKSFSGKNINPITFGSYDINTRAASGEHKEINEYTDEELVQVLHLSKKIVSNSGAISLASKSAVPVHKIRAFAEMIMSEINSR
jgi:hypothetical protein